jgi:hypothetical protein
MDRRSSLRLGAVLLVAAFAATGADWPQFRGPNGSGTSEATGLPTTWSDSQNVLWKVDMPGPGSSSPIIVGNRVYLTCYSGYGQDARNPGDPQELERHLVCLNLENGELMWNTPIGAELPEDRYGGQLTQHGYASSTPAADGERVFTFFGKTGVLAFDTNGKELWRTSVGKGSGQMGWGTAASLILHKNMVIVNANAESQSVVALDKASGSELWKASAEGYAGSWSTPILVSAEGDRTDLVINVPGEVWGLNPDDGKLRWFFPGIGGNAATASLVSADGLIFAMTGGPGGSNTAAIRAGGRDDVTATHVAWQKRVGSYVPSPLVYQGRLTWVDDSGIAHCHDAATGDEHYRERLGGNSRLYASVIAADDKLFVVTRRSGTFVLDSGKEYKVLATNVFESDSTDFNASPAITDGRIILRSNQAVYCIGQK